MEAAETAAAVLEAVEAAAEAVRAGEGEGERVCLLRQDLLLAREVGAPLLLEAQRERRLLLPRRGRRLLERLDLARLLHEELRRARRRARAAARHLLAQPRDLLLQLREERHARVLVAAHRVLDGARALREVERADRLAVRLARGGDARDHHAVRVAAEALLR